MKDDNPNAGLRQEIVESQKTQADFLKWKLIAVGLLSSFSLVSTTTGHASSGTVLALPGTGHEEVTYLLCLIPLLCGYVDLISLHLMIRIITIGAFLKESGNKYEEFAFSVRGKAFANPFVFEPGALHGSSLVFNGLIVLLGCVLKNGKAPWLSLNPEIFIVAGCIGFFWSLLLWAAYVWRARQVTRLAKEFFNAGGEKATEPAPVEP